MTYQPPVPPPYRGQHDQPEQAYSQPHGHQAYAPPPYGQQHPGPDFGDYQSQPMRHPRFYQRA